MVTNCIDPALPRAPTMVPPTPVLPISCWTSPRSALREWGPSTNPVHRQAETSGLSARGEKGRITIGFQKNARNHDMGTEQPL